MTLDEKYQDINYQQSVEYIRVRIPYASTIDTLKKELISR
jgi:hypothetical protein